MELEWQMGCVGVDVGPKPQPLTDQSLVKTMERAC